VKANEVRKNDEMNGERRNVYGVSVVKPEGKYRVIKKSLCT
jgi:hypothetical protein